MPDASTMEAAEDGRRLGLSLKPAAPALPGLDGLAGMFRRGVFGYLPVSIAQAGAGFGSIFVFTRILSPQSYGLYALAYTASALTGLIALTWIEAAMARFSPAEVEGPGRVDLFATLYGAFALAAGGLLIIGPAVVLLSPARGEMRQAALSGLLFIVFRSLLKMAQERRRAFGEVFAYASLELIQIVLGFGLGVIFALSGGGGGSPLLGQGLACAVCAAFAAPFEIRIALRGRFDGRKLAACIAYGAPLSLSLMMSLALAATDRFVLAADVGGGAVGAYHAGYSLSSRSLDVIFLWLGMAGQPACVAALERGGRSALQKAARAQASSMFLVAVPAAVGLALLAGPLAGVMIGPALAPEAAAVTPLIALSSLLAGFTAQYFNTAYTLARRTRRLFAALAIPAAANLGLVLALVPRFGLLGAAAATVLSYALGLAASLILAPRSLRLPTPLGDLVKSLTASAAMAALVLRLPASGGVEELIVKTLAGAAVYALAALALDICGCRRAAFAALRRRGAPRGARTAG